MSDLLESESERIFHSVRQILVSEYTITLCKIQSLAQFSVDRLRHVCYCPLSWFNSFKMLMVVSIYASSILVALLCLLLLHLSSHPSHSSFFLLLLPFPPFFFLLLTFLTPPSTFSYSYKLRKWLNMLAVSFNELYCSEIISA